MNGFTSSWEDESQYPSTENPLTYTQWAWEFLRRNKEYQESFLVIQQIVDEEDKRRKSLEVGKLYGLTVGLLDPWNTTSEDIADAHIFDGPTRLIVGDKKQKLSDHQAAVIFDLRYPIAAQIKHVADELIDRQRYLMGNKLHVKKDELKLTPINIKGRADKYATYLRILDAKSIQPNLSNKKIASIIYSKLLNSKNGQNLEKKVDNAYREAKELRDLLYREIGMKGTLEH